MAVTTTTSRVSYTGDGTSAEFPFPYYFLRATDITAYVGGIKQTSGFTVSGAGLDEGGSVTFVTAPAAGLDVILLRDPDQLQNTKLPPNDPFPSKAVETVLDKLTMLIQRLFDRMARTIMFPDADINPSSELPVAALRSNKGLGFDVAGNPVAIDLTIGNVLAPVVHSIAMLRLTSKLLTTDVFVLGYYVAGDGGGGSYYLDPVDHTSADNGGTVIVAADGGRWKLQSTGRISVKQFGAKGDGATDDTTALQAAYTYAASAGRTAWHPDGTYCATGLVAGCSIHMEPLAQLLYVGVDNGTLLNVTGSNTKHGVIRVWGNAKNVMPLQISGSGNDIAAIYSGGVTATATGSLTIVGVGIYGDTNTIGRIRLSSMINAGHPNDSFPQAVLAYGDQNTIESIVLNDCRSGLVISNPVTVYVDSIICRNMADNGIYQLMGYLRLGRLEYAGVEEPAVFKGEANVDEISIIGNSLGVGFQDCGSVSIDRLSVRPDSAGNTTKFLFRTRGGSVSCGRIDIGRITGRFTGSTLFAMDQGAVEYLAIGGMDVKFQYDAAVCVSPGSFANMAACQGFRWENTLIEVIDLNNAIGSTVLAINAPTVVKHSFLKAMDLQIYQSNGIAETSAALRGVGFAQALIETSGVHWRTDIGPYIVSVNAAGALADTANAIPSAGTWSRGKVLWQSFPQPSGTSGWVCVASGTPGTWKTFGSIAA